MLWYLNMKKVDPENKCLDMVEEQPNGNKRSTLVGIPRHIPLSEFTIVV